MTEPHEPTFYLDESIFSKVLYEHLKVLPEIRVTRVGIAVQKGTPDQEWLDLCGRNNWIVLMRDKRIRYRRLEKEALKRADVGAFVFVGGNRSSIETSEAIVPLIPKMVRLHSAENTPFIYSFGISGVLRPVPI